MTQRTTDAASEHHDAQLPIDVQSEIAAVQRISAIPTILDVVCATTGMGFAAVARVTEDRWIACNVKDLIGFGLKPGGELKIETTICNEILRHRKAVVIDHVADDPTYMQHATPAMYGFQSYISMPIILSNGTFFGTLCAIDSRPAQLKNADTIGMFKLFAELIAFNIDAYQKLADSEAALVKERFVSNLREQFIAVLGHDLRNPLAAINSGTELLLKTPINHQAQSYLGLIKKSVRRMSGLIENVLDFARGRLGGGFVLNMSDESLTPILEQVAAELHASFPQREIEIDFAFSDAVHCDPARIAQLFSNLLANALTYGEPSTPVRAHATIHNNLFELSVSNTGEPIPPETMERLFQPFSRGELRPNQQGLGLGLYIAAEIARAHGGILTAFSNANETRFTLRFPHRSS